MMSSHKCRDSYYKARLYIETGPCVTTFHAVIPGKLLAIFNISCVQIPIEHTTQLNSLRPIRNGHHFTDDNFKRILS